MKIFQNFFEIFFTKNQNKAHFGPFWPVFGRFSWGFGMKNSNFGQNFRIFFFKNWSFFGLLWQKKFSFSKMTIFQAFSRRFWLCLAILAKIQNFFFFKISYFLAIFGVLSYFSPILAKKKFFFFF